MPGMAFLKRFVKATKGFGVTVTLRSSQARQPGRPDFPDITFYFELFLMRIFRRTGILVA